MNYKALIILFLLVLFVLASILVYNNRASDKLVSNFISVIVLGCTGLIITSLVTLKKEEKRESFNSILFLKDNPITEIISRNRTSTSKGELYPILFINNALNRSRIENEKYFSTDEFKEGEYFEFTDKVLQRYILELLVSRYHSHWYYESYHIKGPSLTQGRGHPIDSLIPTQEFYWSDLSNFFPTNDLINIGFYKELNSTKLSRKSFNLPPKTSISLNEIPNGFSIVFDNKFINVSIDVTHATPDYSMNEDIIKAFRLNTTNKYIFQPYHNKVRIVKKKFRSGHPDMHRYDHWANDMLNLIKVNLGEDRFWDIVKSG